MFATFTCPVVGTQDWVGSRPMLPPEHMFAFSTFPRTGINGWRIVGGQALVSWRQPMADNDDMSAKGGSAKA